MTPTRPLRILQVLEPSGGGSGRHFVDLCGALKAEGHHVTAIYSPMRAEARFVAELEALQLDGVHRINMRRAPHPSDIAALVAIWQVMRNAGPFDIVHAHSSKAGALTRMRLPGPHTPRVYTPHAFRTMDPTLGAKGRLLFGTIERFLGKYLTDKIICVSNDEFEHARDRLGIPAARLSTIVNGVESPPSLQRAQLRAQWGINPEDTLFGFVGRLSHQKAPERLIAAFLRVAPAMPSARLVMIGSGELRENVEAQIHHANLTDRVQLRNDVDGSHAMQAFDALVMPSRYEAMSYVMLEAAAAGKPMILSDVGGASTVLECDKNGILVRNDDDPAELADAMLRFTDATAREVFTTAAALRRDNYSLAHMAKQTIAVYEQLADK